MNNSQKGLLYISGTIISWGVLAIILKIANKYIDSITIVWLRFFVAYLILTLYLFFKDKKLLILQAKPPKRAIFAAILLAANYLGFMKGVEITTPSNTQVIIQVGPLTLALLGIFYLKEKIGFKQKIGFLIAITGFIIFYKNQLNALISSKDYNIGVLWIIMAALTWALYAIIQKVLIQKFDSRSLNLIIYGVPSLIYLPFADFKTLLSLGILKILFLSVLGLNTVIAYGCLSESFKYLPANKISILITLNPMITILLSLLLGYIGFSWAPEEALNRQSLLGALLVLTGAVLVVSKQKQLK